MLKDYARNGAQWAKDALTLRPCEMWQEIKGRTIWFAGDSVTQVRIWRFATIEYGSVSSGLDCPRASNLPFRSSFNQSLLHLTTGKHAILGCNTHT